MSDQTSRTPIMNGFYANYFYRHTEEKAMFICTPCIDTKICMFICTPCIDTKICMVSHSGPNTI